MSPEARQSSYSLQQCATRSRSTRTLRIHARSPVAFGGVPYGAYARPVGRVTLQARARAGRGCPSPCI
eukprot:9435464-Heterocapsa_arctica.AAC.1